MRSAEGFSRLSARNRGLRRPCGNIAKLADRYFHNISYPTFTAAVIYPTMRIYNCRLFARQITEEGAYYIMAIYHCSIKIVSRGKGKSAVAAAAYRAGEKITNEYDGITHDYTRKGGVVHTEILLPEHAPREYSDRAVLWNAVEKIEKAANSQLAREIELALPMELTREQSISLIREYVKNNFVDLGMCADICVHDKNDGNPHAHIMLTTRPFNDDKSWRIKERKDYALDENGNRIPIIDEATGLQKTDGRNRKQWKRVYVQANDWNDQTKAEEWRAAWAESVNTVLGKQGVEERVDHRSYERQGIEQIPTVHMGVAATQMEQRGIVTERGNMNREILRMNQILFAILAKLKQLKDRLKDAVVPVVHSGRAEKPSIMAQFEKYKKEIAQTQKPEPSTLDDLCACFDRAHENLKHIDRRLKNANGVEEFDKILIERTRAFNEYAALKAEVKKSEASLPQRKLRSRDMGR